MNKCICVFLPRRVKKDKNKIEGTPILKLAMVKKKLYTVGIHTVGIHTVLVYSRVQKNWNEVFFKILEEPSIVQKKMIPHIKGLDFSQR